MGKRSKSKSMSSRIRERLRMETFNEFAEISREIDDALYELEFLNPITRPLFRFWDPIPEDESLSKDTTLSHQTD